MAEMGTKLQKQYKPKKRRGVFGLAVFVVVILLMVACSFFSYMYVVDSHKNENKDVAVNVDPQTGIPVDIPMDSSTSAIANILQENGIIRYPLVFKIMSKVNGYDGMYKSGTHIVSKDLDYDKIMRVLISNPVSIRVTIPEGFTYKQISDTLAQRNLIDKDKFNNITNSGKFDFKFLKNIPQRGNRLEGYLFPDTYEFDVKAGEKEIANRMLERFDQMFKPEYYDKAKKLNMTPDQIIILASIIEKEAKLADERKIIAGVFYNRLNNKDKAMRRLQSCATIQYIFLNKEGVVKQKITDNDTKINDPYNTYQIVGLPPGTICSPGQASIEAALNPEKTDYLYFVAKGDGSHYFSKTLQEHLAAVKKYETN